MANPAPPAVQSSGTLPDRFTIEFVAGAAPKSHEWLEAGCREDDGFCWYATRRDSEGARSALEGLGLDELTLEALFAEETRPRFAVHDEGIILILRGVNLHPGAEPEDMISVRIWADRRKVVCVWLRSLKAMEDLLDNTARGVSYSNPVELIAKLALRLADRAEPLVSTLNEKLDLFEGGIEEANSASLRRDLADVRKTAIILRRYMFPQRDALTTFEIEDLSWDSREDRHLIKEAGNRVTRLAEELEAIRERASVIHDELLARQSDALNHRMLTLSVVAAIFLPLSLLSGLLGMNVGGMPGVESPWGFWISTGLIVALGLAQYWVLKKLKLF